MEWNDQVEVVLVAFQSTLLVRWMQGSTEVNSTFAWWRPPLTGGTYCIAHVNKENTANQSLFIPSLNHTSQQCKYSQSTNLVMQVHHVLSSYKASFYLLKISITLLQILLKSNYQRNCSSSSTVPSRWQRKIAETCVHLIFCFIDILFT